MVPVNPVRRVGPAAKRSKPAFCVGGQLAHKMMPLALCLSAAFPALKKDPNALTADGGQWLLPGESQKLRKVFWRIGKSWFETPLTTRFPSSLKIWTSCNPLSG